jgi:uncharacterized protein YcfJ
MRNATCGMVLMVLAGMGHAATDFIDTAEVISSTPIIERVSEPREECSRAAADGPKDCRTVTVTREYVKGYAVVYRYNGRDIRTTLPSDPGPTVRVGIGVIDGVPARRAPAAGALGSNVREVVETPKTPPASPPKSEGNRGGYQYRY